MKRIKKIMLIALILILTINPVYAKEKVKFSKCVDGDTIKVEVGSEIKTVRLLAVDTPESVHPSKGLEYYGKEASNYTCDKVTNAKKIELEYDSASEKEDKYGRLLAWVWVDNSLLQDDLIKNGYAEVAYLYGNYKYTSLLQDHEKIAESAKIGIWNEDARKEFDSSSSSENKTTKDNEKVDTFDINNMSTKEIIVLIVIVVLVSLLTPVIKKIERKIKKMLK